MSRGASRIGARRRIVGIEAGAVAAPIRGDRRPIERRIAHCLAPFGMANTGFQRIQPAALVDVEFQIRTKRRFDAAVVFFVPLNEGNPIVVRVRQPPGRVIDIGTGQQLDLRGSAAVHAVLVIGH